MSSLHAFVCCWCIFVGLYGSMYPSVALVERHLKLHMVERRYVSCPTGLEGCLKVHASM